jgi:DNA-binding NarL/FixJ family response regulator
MIKHYFNTKISNIDDREIRDETFKYANAYLSKTDFESEQLIEALSTMIDNYKYAGNDKVHNMIKETVVIINERNQNLYLNKILP